MISVLLPIRIESVSNLREHWSVRHRRNKVHQKAASTVPAHPLPCVVTLTRIAPRQLDSHDNLRIAFKATVDQIAKQLGVDDADPRVEWRYSQRKGAPKQYAAAVEILGAGEGA